MSLNSVLVARAQAAPRDDAQLRPLAPLPRVLLLTGQDLPDPARVARTWRRACSPAWPRHQLTIAGALPDRAQPDGYRFVREDHLVEPARTGPNPSAPQASRGVPLGRLATGLTTRLIARLDADMCIEPRSGQPVGFRSRLVARHTAFSLACLYDPEGTGARAIANADAALAGRPPLLVVGHSFGGTLAQRLLWQRHHAGDPTPRALMTLGTNCGPTVVRSPLFSPLREAGRVRLPNTIDWHHYLSDSDVLVAAPAPPRAFEGVTCVRVDTGPLTHRLRRTHALAAYLGTPEVTHHIGARLQAAARPLAKPG